MYLQHNFMICYELSWITMSQFTIFLQIVMSILQNVKIRESFYM